MHWINRVNDEADEVRLVALRDECAALFEQFGLFYFFHRQIERKEGEGALADDEAGYVGYDEGGQLTKAIRRKPYAVVLFDEVEKAHPDVFNVLLQVLDDGRFTDSQGRTVDFKNTVIIVTSNLGSRHLLEGVTGDTIPEAVREAVFADLRKAFRPEFLNRIEETILFQPLTLDEITRIVDLLMADLNKRLAERRVIVEFDKKAKEWPPKKAMIGPSARARLFGG